MTFTEELQRAARAAAELALPAVVGVGSRGQVGTGMVIADGRVLTSAHNVRSGTRSLHFRDGARAEGSAAATDLGSDLAVLTVDTRGITPIRWADEPVELGTPVFGAARPGRRETVLSLGMVAQLDQPFSGPAGRLIRGGFQHTAPLPPGASGGPVLTLAGRLLGVNTRRMGEGLYMAVGGDPQLRARVERLIQGEVTGQAWLGVGLLPPEMATRLRLAVGLPEHAGLLVREVLPESPAAAAGLRQGDLLVAAHGRPLAAVDDLHSLLADLPVGTAIRLSLVRGPEELEVAATLAAEPEHQNWVGGGRPHGRRGPFSG